MDKAERGQLTWTMCTSCELHIINNSEIMHEKTVSIPVINCDGYVREISVTEDTVSKKHLEEQQENCHGDCRSKTNQ